MPKASKLTADIFIPTSNRLDSLNNCLQSLVRQTQKDFRIILIGLKKDSQIKTLIQKFPSLKITYKIQRKKGLIIAANQALKLSSRPIFVRIDDDVYLSKNWYKNLINTFAKDKSIGGVTGPTIMSKSGIKARDLTSFLTKFRQQNNLLAKFFYKLYYDYLYEGQIKQPSLFLESGLFTLGSNFPQAAKLNKILEVSNLEACNFSARTKILKQIGGFDPIYLKGLGDYHEADAALKIKRSGFRLVFNPKVKLYHRVEMGTVPKARPAAFYRIQNFLIFYFRFFKFKSPNQVFKFSLNLIMQNFYYTYRFLTTGKINQLGAIPGTLIGILNIIFNRPKYGL